MRHSERRHVQVGLRRGLPCARMSVATGRLDPLRLRRAERHGRRKAMTARRQYGVRLSRSNRLELERHSDAPRRQPWRSWAEQQAAEGPVAVDLFAGAGGLSHGLEAAGYRVILSVDHDPMAVETHLSNFPGPCLDLDLAEPDRLEDLLGLLAGLDVDLVAGGPPCQPFSRAGRSKIRDLVDRGVREALDPRRELWRAFLRVAEEVRPRAVLMENVPDMALGDDMRTVRYMAERLDDRFQGFGRRVALKRALKGAQDRRAYPTSNRRFAWTPTWTPLRPHSMPGPMIC
jgi:hypothetical protein